MSERNIFKRLDERKRAERKQKLDEAAKKALKESKEEAPDEKDTSNEQALEELAQEGDAAPEGETLEEAPDTETSDTEASQNGTKQEKLEAWLSTCHDPESARTFLQEMDVISLVDGKPVLKEQE